MLGQSTAMATRSRTVSAVPEDIVRTVYTLGFLHGALTLHDRQAEMPSLPLCFTIPGHLLPSRAVEVLNRVYAGV